MGHIRLGRLPRTRRWKQVVELLGDPQVPADEVARATLLAARHLFGNPQEHLAGMLANDPGLVSSFYVLAHTALRSKAPDFLESLKREGIDVPPDDSASALRFVVRLSETARKEVARSPNPTAFSEIAVLALRETLSDAISQHSDTLFGTTVESVRAACRRYAEPERFGGLARRFFGNFLYRTMAFFVSKAVPDEVGPGERFEQLSEVHGFHSALRSWCNERAKIVESFAGGWTSKEDYERGIDMAAAKRFVAVAVGKLGSEVGELDPGVPDG